MKTIHNFLGIVTILFGLLSMLISALIPSSYQPVRDFFSNAGSAILAIGVVETFYKTFLQEELINSLVVKFHRALKLPVESVYLRRSEVPKERDISKVWDSVKDTIYIKAASYSTSVRQNLTESVERALNKNPRLKIRFLIYNSKSPSAQAYADLSNRKLSVLCDSVNEFTDKLDKIKSKFPQQLDYALYNSFPVCNIWIVDPEQSNAWARISPIMPELKPNHESIVIFISRYQDVEYYDELYSGIRQLWEESKQLSKGVNPNP